LLKLLKAQFYSSKSYLILLELSKRVRWTTGHYIIILQTKSANDFRCQWFVIFMLSVPGVSRLQLCSVDADLALSVIITRLSVN